MNPAKIVALIPFALSLQGLIPFLLNQRDSLPLFSLLWIILAIFLWRKSKGAFRIFRFLTWFIFIISLFVTLMIIFRTPRKVISAVYI